MSGKKYASSRQQHVQHLKKYTSSGQEHVQRLKKYTSSRQEYVHHLKITCIMCKITISSSSEKLLSLPLSLSICMVGWLVVLNVPLTVRSFRDGTPIDCPLRRTSSSVFTPFPPFTSSRQAHVHHLCLWHYIPVWLHIGQSTTATSSHCRDMTSDV